MKSRPVFFALLAMLAMILFSACGGAAATEAPAQPEAPQTYVESYAEPAQPQVPLEGAQPQLDKSGESAANAPSVDVIAAPTMGPAVEIANASGENIVVQNTNRKIIKNADVRLLVKDTDVAIDRTTQIIGDLGGYIISSRVWYQDYYGNNLKYSTMTLGVPVDQFERALTRLRELAIRVLEENASGEDVTDQYVDLQSQLENLEATRARIQEFLTDAKTVDEALRINQELANIEAQIEQIKGRMNYLNDRAAFSTITINFEPEFPVLTPTPTATIAPTNTPRPTPTLVPWKPGETFNDAQRTVTVAYRGIFDFIIWLVVVVLPILLPPAIVIWALWKVFTRKQNKPSGGSTDSSAKSE